MRFPVKLFKLNDAIKVSLPKKGGQLREVHLPNTHFVTHKIVNHFKYMATLSECKQTHLKMCHI